VKNWEVAFGEFTKGIGQEMGLSKVSLQVSIQEYLVLRLVLVFARTLGGIQKPLITI